MKKDEMDTLNNLLLKAQKKINTNDACELKVYSTKKPWNPTVPLALPATPELSALCVIQAFSLKGGKNVSVNNA